jgi:hypothetical protein
MLLRIQKDESLRSYVERNLFVPNTILDNDAAESFSCCNWNSSQVKLVADLLGWHGCYGFNKLLHQHTAYSWKVVLKSRFNYSYSGDAYLNTQENFDSLSKVRAYCPVCAKEDKQNLGYSYWRRIHPDVQVCAKHNVVLLTTCQFCNRPFARGGHTVSVMWSGWVNIQLSHWCSLKRTVWLLLMASSNSDRLSISSPCSKSALTSR